MTLQELKEKTKHELSEQLVNDLEAGKDSHLLNLIRKYMEKNYHVVKRDLTAKDKYNQDYMINVMLETISADFGVSIEQIKGLSRKSPLPEVRHIYFYLARLISDNTISFEKLGESIGRDHATALYAGKKIRGYMEVDKGFENRINELAELCRYKLRDC